MKIIAGIYGGRKLITPKNQDIRPTSDKIRGAIFNMLQSRGAIEGANVLDAFCGTGALGIEALSRGAAHCDFIDKIRASLELAQKNAMALDLTSEAVSFKLKNITNTSDRQSDKNAYSLIFIDPPYNKNLVNETLSTLIKGNWLITNCWIICETGRKESITLINGLILDNEKTYGDTKITLLNYQPITPE